MIILTKGLSNFTKLGVFIFLYEFLPFKFFFNIQKYKKNKKMNLHIILNIKSKITEKNLNIINKSYQISFKNKTKQNSGEIIKTISFIYI